ncbi:hypothetical protein [Occallatibacter riparius]|uniref:Uncharacterized protein n=1 Tax=Occallatibacter riparius TaxID=1002689 RepID=A0A9J7BWS2_9BACT|nr:hypothetical protein [Occallatibacter riparius]UWZ86937.1 hypothetical protein MOP44_13535 [Occallatibacter riparius]
MASKGPMTPEELRLAMALLKISEEVSRRIPREQLAKCKTTEELWKLVHEHMDEFDGGQEKDQQT